MRRKVKVVKMQNTHRTLGAALAAITALGAAGLMMSKRKPQRSSILSKITKAAAATLALGEVVAPRATARALQMPRQRLNAWMSR